LLRPRLENRLPQRAIAESLDLSQGAISTYLSRARAARVGWPIPEELDVHGSRRCCSHRCAGHPPISGRCPTGPGCTASCAAPM
jgi:hypothetical protein